MFRRGHLNVPGKKEGGEGRGEGIQGMNGGGAGALEPLTFKSIRLVFNALVFLRGLCYGLMRRI